MTKLLITTLLCVAILPAADIAGTWLGQIPTTTATGDARGTFQQVAFQFVQNGTKLTGKLYGDLESAPIIEGKVTDDQIEFVTHQGALAAWRRRCDSHVCLAPRGATRASRSIGARSPGICNSLKRED